MPDSPSMPPEQDSVRPASIGASIPYERFLDCVHCGLCTSACPTYVETGDENDSPRGRIYLMRSVVDGRLPLTDSIRGHLDLCLDCRSCETACPSGVQYGRLLEPFRVDMQAGTATAVNAAGDVSPVAAPKRPDWFHRWILYGLFPYAGRMRWALFPARIAQMLRLDRVAEAIGLPNLLPARLRRMYRQLPRLEPGGPALHDRYPAIGTKRATVALFTGCVADAMFRRVHRATISVLRHNGCEVVVPRGQTCCGAIHYHSGSVAPALKRAVQNAECFRDDEIDAVIVNVAGCGSMLKDYGHVAEEELPADDAAVQSLKSFTGKVRDISEFLAELGPLAPPGRITSRVALQDACHLQHAQRITSAPREILRQVEGLELLEINEAELCCGAAGTYAMTQPEMSDRLGRRKVEHLMATVPDVIASANAGCALQLQATLRDQGHEVDVLHPIELVARAWESAAE